MIETLIPQIQSMDKISCEAFNLMRSGDKGLLELASEALFADKEKLMPFIGWLNAEISVNEIYNRFAQNYLNIKEEQAPFVSDYFIVDHNASIIGGISFVIDQSIIPSFLVGNLWVLPKHQDNHHGSKAISLLTNSLFNTLGAKRVEAQIEPENIASLKSFTKAGFTEEGMKRNGHYSSGRICDVLVYSKIRK